MSFFGFQKRPSSEEKLAAAEMEVKMMVDMQSRMSKLCHQKCIPDYREGELNKGESVCLDRCVAKFFETHMKVSEIMQEQQRQTQAQAGGGKGAFGFRM